MGGGKRMHCVGWKPDGRRPLGRVKYKWEDNIKIDLKNRMRGCGTDSGG